jgi:hypothetical protein
MKRNDARRTQRGFFAIGIALAIVAGFSVAGFGAVELAEGEAQAVAETAQPAPTVAAHTGGDAGAY